MDFRSLAELILYYSMAAIPLAGVVRTKRAPLSPAFEYLISSWYFLVTFRKCGLAGKAMSGGGL